MLRFPEKTPSEKVTASMDFAARLDDDSIESAAVSIALRTGAGDRQPEAMLDGDALVSGSKVLQRLEGGRAGVSYVLKFLATLSDGTVLEEQARVDVVDFRS